MERELFAQIHLMTSRVLIDLPVLVALVAKAACVVTIRGGGFFASSGFDPAYMQGKDFAIAALLVLACQYLLTAKIRFLKRFVFLVSIQGEGND